MLRHARGTAIVGGPYDNGTGRRRGKRRVKQLISTVCEQPFPTNRRDARYCTNACRQEAYRERR
jgi:hypothetical protein